MKRGKQICETLKGIRCDIARANEIEYTPRECQHVGDCSGTCPACEGEMRWLEGQLRLRHQLGKVVTIAGLSLGAISLASCNSCAKPFQPDGMLEDSDQPVMLADSDSIDKELVREVSSEPQEIDGVTQPEDPNDNRECPAKNE